MAARLNILVIDDELNIRKVLAACLEAEGHEVVAVGTAADAMQAGAQRSFDLAFVDLVLGRDAGLELFPKLLAQSPWMKVVVVTAYATVDTAVESMKRGASDYLPKPFTPEQVELVTRRVQEVQSLQRRVAELEEAAAFRGAAPSFETASAEMQQALTMARQVAATEAAVLIVGEHGVGKATLAQAIHSWSGRAAKPCAVVLCDSIPGGQVELELFGAQRGAVPGATRDKPGLIGGCDGGTLFLDEVGSLPPAAQGKLLRLMRERVYERLGDTGPRTADVRVIASSSADLNEAVAQRKFDRDLLLRLGVIQIAVPPLRSRPADVVALAHHMLGPLMKQHRRPAVTIGAAAEEAMRSYPWPGNVAELRNVLERAVILCEGPEIGPEHLFSRPAGSKPPAVGDAVSLDKLEELHIRAVLSTCPAIEEAAGILGIDTVTLWRRRKKYGI
jgi:NtrC-family two-component system response regulator AlgB